MCTESNFKSTMSLIWWLAPIILAFGRLRQEDNHKFQASQGYRVRLCLGGGGVQNIPAR